MSADTELGSVRLFLTPSLKITGGNLEIVKLGCELADQGVSVAIVPMMRTAHEIDVGGLTVIRLSCAQISPIALISRSPFIARRFVRLVKRTSASIVFTHYATLMLDRLAPSERRWYFVQDLEWQFVHGTVKRDLLKSFIIGRLRSGRVMSANRYLTDRLTEVGLKTDVEVSIWADRAFGLDSPQTGKHADLADHTRIHDLVVMLRRGAHKRADLTMALIDQLLRADPEARIVAISPDASFRSSLPTAVRYMERPTVDQMREVYKRTRIFALLSDHEGFGLPPLEAMGQGCVPVCRNAGGVGNYMIDELQENILPLSSAVPEVANFVLALLKDPVRLKSMSDAAQRIFREGGDRSSARASNLLTAGF